MGKRGQQEVHPLGYSVDSGVGDLTEGAVVMLPLHPVCCTYTPSTTHASLSSIPEPQVPENQDALHTHSPCSQNSRLPLSCGKGLFLIPHGMAGQDIREYLLCRVHACVLIHVNVPKCVLKCVIVCINMCTCTWIEYVQGVWK